MTTVAVMGSGSWGTAFGMVLADAGCDVVMWAKEQAVAEAIAGDHENPAYHPGVRLPASLRATHDPALALSGAELVVLAIPAQALRSVLAGWVPALGADTVLVSLMKGIELGTMRRMSEVVIEVADVDPGRVAVVSGPNLAREIMQRQPAATVVACADEETARRVQLACLTPYFRPYTNTDVVGVELGGSVKNVIAIANGVAAGLGFGENAQASLITRGLAEMTRLGVALGADPTTFAGLAGIGDLIATCTSPLSRNRTFGFNLGGGMTPDEATAAMKQTCEGVKSCRPILALAERHGVDMPITDAVVQAVHQGLAPREMARMLMTRDAKPEQSAV
ncbi:MAG: NAD(P)H-dependent glycerol-3-phosphate dehydrogenase [Actinomycetes bacterium]